MEVIWEEYFIFLHASKKVYLAKSFDIHFMKVNSCVKKKEIIKGPRWIFRYFVTKWFVTKILQMEEKKRYDTF